MNHTQSVTSMTVGTWDELDAAPPGAVFFLIEDDGAKQHLIFNCPCGCSQPCVIPIAGTPSWQWDGNREQPTLSPSIRRAGRSCKWHGHLVAGVWTPCGDSGQ